MAQLLARSVVLPSFPLVTPSSSSTPVQKKIFSDDDIPNWLQSEAYHYLELMIARLSVAVDGKKIEDPCIESPQIKSLVQFLNNLTEWVDDIPLQTSPQRFGNKAFRDWIAVMEENESTFQPTLLDPTQLPCLPELSYHFTHSFGSGPRLDYGTGHELSFLAYLTILRLVGVFKEEDEQAVVTRVFVAYLALVRKLQKVFKLEPAGSKGVWGLDDHQHLSYLWGASQLRTHPTVRPAAILSPSALNPLGVSYLFLSSILHINDLKRGPFAEHSPILHNIATTVPNWAKVTTGLMRMYREEVLKKVPVVQHFRFGNILSWRRVGAPESEGDMSSTGDGVDEEVKNEVENGPEVVDRVRDDGTVAPWALPSLSATTPPPLAPVRIPSSSSITTIPFRNSPSPSNSALATTPPSPKPFVPPQLFPAPLHRRGSLLSGAPIVGHEQTVLDDGGAAAMSSPFGVLKSATLGYGSGNGKPWTDVDSKDGN